MHVQKILWWVLADLKEAVFLEYNNKQQNHCQNDDLINI